MTKVAYIWWKIDGYDYKSVVPKDDLTPHFNICCRSKPIPWAIFYASWISGPGLIPNIPPKKISQEKIGDIAEVNQRRYLVESWQWLENVVRTS